MTTEPIDFSFLFETNGWKLQILNDVYHTIDEDGGMNVYDDPSRLRLELRNYLFPIQDTDLFRLLFEIGGGTK
jgi:hypothetical protein